jgi:hypothetical protein
MFHLLYYFHKLIQQIFLFRDKVVLFIVCISFGVSVPPQAAEKKWIPEDRKFAMEQTLLNCQRPEVDSVKFQPETWLSAQDF